MPHNTSHFICHFIHFENNTKQQNKNDGDKVDVLYKIRHALNKLMQRMRLAGIPGANFTIDERMIKYCKRAIAFVQDI